MQIKVYENILPPSLPLSLSTFLKQEVDLNKTYSFQSAGLNKL